MNDLALFEEMIALNQKNMPFALATVVESSGSSPRKAGAKMLVRADRSISGTIGGGAVEQEVIDAALAALNSGRPQTTSFVLTENYGHVCGGKLLVFIEPLGLTQRLLIFGAGHVGQALAKASKFAGFRVVVIDERAEYARDGRLPDADEIIIGESGKVLSNMRVDKDDFIVITTPTHEGDFDAARAAIKTPAGYIGMIGSKRKREVLLKILRKEGVTEKDLNRLIIPVGLSIGAESPQEIAISIVSEMIQKKSRVSGMIGNSASRQPAMAVDNVQGASAG